MRLFVGNLIMALFWMLLTASISLGNFIQSFAICYFILWVVFRKSQSNSYFSRGKSIIKLAFHFIKLLVTANLAIAFDILTPGTNANPAIIAYETGTMSRLQFMIFSNLITLTPGTMSMEFDAQKKVLYVHILYFDGAKAEKLDLFKLRHLVVKSFT